jgi:hypothetical protein
MLVPRVGVAVLGIDGFDPSGEYRYAVSVGAALMAGWTVLPPWVDRKSVERRTVLTPCTSFSSATTSYREVSSHAIERARMMASGRGDHRGT